MKPVFDRVLVALDLSYMDSRLLQMTAAMAPVLGMKKIYFLHVMPEFFFPGIPETSLPVHLEDTLPVDEQAKEHLKAQVAQVFDGQHGLETEVEVVEGYPFQTLLHWLDVKHIDLLVAGRKAVEAGSGITARRLARHSRCHVLFVPDQETPDWHRILAPIDFSQYSARALQVAQQIRQAQSGIELRALYVMNLPLSDYYMRKFDTEALRHVLREAAHQTCDDFLEDLGLNTESLPVDFVENTEGSIARHIEAQANAWGSGLLVLGAQGHSAAAQLLYGSVTERVVDGAAPQAILVVR